MKNYKLIKCDSQVPGFDKAWELLVEKNKNRMQGMLEMIEIYDEVLKEVYHPEVKEDDDGRSVIL